MTFAAIIRTSPSYASANIERFGEGSLVERDAAGSDVKFWVVDSTDPDAAEHDNVYVLKEGVWGPIGGGTVDLTAIQSQLDAQAAVDVAQAAVDAANEAVDDAQTAALADKENAGLAATLDAALQTQITANADLNTAQQTAITANIAAIAALQASIVKPDYDAAETDAAGILNKPDLTQSETFNADKAAAGEYVQGVSRVLWNGHQYMLNTDAVLQAARANSDVVDQTALPSSNVSEGGNDFDWVRYASEEEIIREAGAHGPIWTEERAKDGVWSDTNRYATGSDNESYKLAEDAADNYQVIADNTALADLTPVHGDTVLLQSDNLAYWFDTRSTVSGAANPNQNSWVSFGSEIVGVVPANVDLDPTSGVSSWIKASENVPQEQVTGLVDRLVEIEIQSRYFRLPVESCVAAKELKPCTLSVDTRDIDIRGCTFAWVKTSGPDVTIRHSNRPTMYFIAPVGTEDNEVSFELTVTKDSLVIHVASITQKILHWFDNPIYVVDAPYNATFDDATDDRLAIQNAINDGIAQGRPVVLPDTGTAYMGSYLSIRDGVTFFGSIGGNPTLRLPDTMRTHIWLRGIPDGEATNVNSPIISRFTTRPTTIGRDPATRNTDSYGIRCEGVIDPVIYDITLSDRNYKGIWIYLAANHGGSIVEGGIYNCNVLGSRLHDDAADQGIHINFESIDALDAVSRWKASFEPLAVADQVSGFEIIGNVIEGGRYGIGATHFSDGRVENNITTTNTRSISLQQECNNNIVRFNTMNEHYSSAVHVGFASTDNYVQMNDSISTVAIGQGIYQVHTGGYRTTFDSNTVNATQALGPQYHAYIGPQSNGSRVIRSNFTGTCQRAFIAIEPAWSDTRFDPAHLSDNGTEGWTSEDMYGLVVADNSLTPSGTGLLAKEIFIAREVVDSEGSWTTAYETISFNTNTVTGYAADLYEASGPELVGEAAARQEAINDLINDGPYADDAAAAAAGVVLDGYYRDTSGVVRGRLI